MRERGPLPPVMDALRWMTLGGGNRPRWLSAGDSCSRPSRPCERDEQQWIQHRNIADIGRLRVLIGTTGRRRESESLCQAATHEARAVLNSHMCVQP